MIKHEAMPVMRIGLAVAAAAGMIFTSLGAWRIEAKVAVVESLGRETMVYAAAGPLRSYDSEPHEGYLVAYRPSQLSVRHGAGIAFSINPDGTYLFAPSGEAIGFPKTNT